MSTKNPIIAMVFFFTICNSIYAQSNTNVKDNNKATLPKDSIGKTSLIKDLEIPQTDHQDTVIRHLGYSLLYNEEHEQAQWVAYELTKKETNNAFKRDDNFRPDPLVKTFTANNEDYQGSGYDRGHLAPAADMGWSKVAMSESFYFSNMSPQMPDFNRGIWKKLEELTRSWAIENNAIYIVTGPVLEDSLKSIGPNKVSVPKYYYKVILDYTQPGIKGIGFILPNRGSDQSLQSFAVTIDSVEKFTGINFFPLLPDKQETIIERTICTKCWTWKTSKSKTTAKKSAAMVQCKAKTKSGARCKNKTNSKNGFCKQHGGN